MDTTTNNSRQSLIGSAVVFAFFMIGSGHFIPRFGPRRFTAYSMSIACMATIVHFLASKPIAQLAVSIEVFGLALTLALVSTVAPAFLVNAGIQHIGANHASIIGTVGPGPGERAHVPGERAGLGGFLSLEKCRPR